VQNLNFRYTLASTQKKAAVRVKAWTAANRTYRGDSSTLKLRVHR